MTNFVIVDNYTKNVIEKFENFELIHIVMWAENNTRSDWFNVYYIGEDSTNLEAVYEDGNWYEADGVTVLNF